MEEKPSTARIALKWGLIVSVILCVFTVFLYVTDLHKQSSLSLIGYLVLLLGIVMAAREYRSLNNNFLSFGEGLGLGTLTSAVTGIIVSMFSYVYITIIDTTMMQRMGEFQREQMEARGLTEEQIDQAMEAAAIFMQPGFIFIIGFFMYLLIGFVLSLIVSIILKKDKPEMLF